MKALVADDDGSSRYLLTKLLKRWGFEPMAVEDGESALAVMEGEDPPGLLLLDWEMPLMDGLEVCRRLRERETLNPPYIIFLTAKRTPGEMARALDAGASDCIRKPYDWEELQARLRVGERTLKLQAQLLAAQQEMRHLAMYDMLTGIYNRRAVTERLEQEMARAKRTGALVTIGLSDLDHFKEINDTWGHQAGDAVMRAFVEMARNTIRKSDVIGRWGGDEFLILALGERRNEVNPIFERIRSRAEEMTVDAGGNAIRYTVSIGVATASRGESVEDLLQRADLALYSVKNCGKNRTAYAPDVETPAAREYLF